MKPAREFTFFAPGAGCWQAYDPEAKVELWSTALAVAGGSILFDPIALEPQALAELTAQLGPPVAVALTNGNHARATANFDVPIFAEPEAAREFPFPVAHSSREIAARWPELGALSLAGAGPGEVAYTFAPLRLAIIGDAIINLDAHGFIPLPVKYCTAPKQARLSRRALLDYAPERLAFAHGSPILADATARLATLPT